MNRSVMKMKILNIHGFMGATDNKNYKALCGFIPQEDIVSLKLDYINRFPEDILSELSEILKSDSFIIVGQSLGSWYANQLSKRFEIPCIITNPCYFPHKCDIIHESGISEDILAQYIKYSADSKNKNAHTICSDADEIIPDNYDNCVSFSAKVISVHGGHSSIENLSEHLKEMYEFVTEKYFR